MKYQRVTTHLAETMSKLDVDKAMRDDYAKCILADPQILANIVKVIVPEFREYSIKDIIPCIGETIVSLTVPEKLCIKIESDGTEDVDIKDGKIIYDIKFPLYYNGKRREFIINIEAQKSSKKSKLGYQLENRIAYYMGRMISEQKGTEFVNSNYDDLKSVYTIWICMDTEADEDSIIELGLQPRVIYGNTSWLPQRSIMNGAVIRIRSRADVEESKNRLIAMLEVLFSGRARQDKMNQLEEYGLEMTTELEGCVNDMCNISDLLVEESEERGERRGMERGEKQARLDSIRTLMRKLNQTAEEAMDTLDIEEKDRETYRKLL